MDTVAVDFWSKSMAQNDKTVTFEVGFKFLCFKIMDV